MKSFIITLLLVASFSAQAQLTITTNYRQDGVWDEETEEWEVLATDEDMTVFNFDKDLASFRHITNSITSNYTITDWDYDEEKILYTMQVQSDAGNTYEMLIDGINNCVAFFYYDEDDYYIMVRHTIKETHYDE